MPTFELRSDHRISLIRTFDIQIPALEWIRLSESSYETIYVIEGEHVGITVTKKDNSLVFSWESASSRIDNDVLKHLQGTFVFFTDEINVGRNQVLMELRKHYDDIYYMGTSPYRGLLVTILSQNKTAKMTRTAFFNLLRVLREVSPRHIGC